jgi:hypothetical protein
MNHTTVFALLCLVAVLPARAGGVNELTPQEKAAGWRLLFDGKSTDAWRGWKSEEFPSKGWVIEDDCLKCERSNGRPNGGGGDLVTRDAFTDFEFRWEWKMSPVGNSGVIYMVHFRDGGRPGKKLYDGDTGLTPYGHEYQLLDDAAPRYAKEKANRLTASFYDLIAPVRKTLKPAGEFNEGRLIVRGNHVEHWLNGVRVVEYELGSPQVLSLVARSKYAGMAGFGRKSKTPILLQDHGCAVWFRYVKIRDLREGRR